jgi:hypothetical protein
VRRKTQWLIASVAGKISSAGKPSDKEDGIAVRPRLQSLFQNGNRLPINWVVDV